MIIKKMEQNMTKAIFLDYTGTMVKEDEPYTRELLACLISHSDINCRLYFFRRGICSYTEQLPSAAVKCN